MEGGSSSKQASNQKGKSIMIESTGSAKIDNDEYWPLSGKPYVDMILTKSSVKPIYSLGGSGFSGTMGIGWKNEISFLRYQILEGQPQKEGFFTVYLPKKMNKELPSAGAPVVLSCGGKKWDLFYGGTKSTYKFITGWKKFADDNNLKKGDGLVFELLDCSSSKIEFRVQILRGDFPDELMSKDVEGTNIDNPIIID